MRDALRIARTVGHIGYQMQHASSCRPTSRSTALIGASAWWSDERLGQEQYRPRAVGRRCGLPADVAGSRAGH